MQVTLEIPDAFAAHLIASGKDPVRLALESLLIEGYRTRQISESEIKPALGYSTRMQVHALLAEREVPLNYDVEEYHKDLETLRRLDESRAFSLA